MLSITWTCIGFIITLGVLITVHEFGHFLTARFFRVQVEKFSIGFGKTLWSYRNKKNNTEYIIKLFPFGGYIKMFDDSENSVSSKIYKDSFNKKSILQRFLIVASGPIFNLLFSFLIYWGIFLYGMPTFRPMIIDVVKDSIIEKAGIYKNMELKYIDKIPVSDWNEIRIILLSKIGNKRVHFNFIDHSDVNSFLVEKTIDLSHWNPELQKEDPLINLGIQPYNFKKEFVLTRVLHGSPADIAGLKVNDTIININNKLFSTWNDFIHYISHYEEKKITICVLRKEKKMCKILKPELKLQKRFIGIAAEYKLSPNFNEHYTLERYAFFQSMHKAIVKVCKLIKLTISMFIKLFTGYVNFHNLSGPFSIAKGVKTSIEHGIIHYFLFVALISINLGIINLFPLPILDGGHLFFLIIEKIQGKKISEQMQKFGYYISLIILIFFTGISLLNDILKF